MTPEGSDLEESLGGPQKLVVSGRGDKGHFRQQEQHKPRRLDKSCNFGEQHYVYVTKMTGPSKGMMEKETEKISKSHQLQGILAYA